MNQKGIAPILLILSILIVIILAGGYYFSSIGYYPLQPVTNTISTIINQSCLKDSDCHVAACTGGCFNERGLKNKLQLACLMYNDNTCKCVNHTCAMFSPPPSSSSPIPTSSENPN